MTKATKLLESIAADIDTMLALVKNKMSKILVKLDELEEVLERE